MNDDIKSHAIARMQATLSEAFFAPVTWRHNDPNFQNVRSDYYNIWSNIPCGHKKYSYFALYEKLFGHLRGNAVKLLELGVFKGASLRSWKAYFGHDSVIVGVDINEECREHDAPSLNRHVRIGDQSDPEFLAKIIDEFGPFDIVMDDASHVTADQITSFNHLFINGVNPNGIYFIEDTNTSLWSSYQKGAADIFELVRALSIATHFFYADHQYKDYKEEEHPKEFNTILAAKLIEEVRVFESAIAVYKGSVDCNPPLVSLRP